MNCPLMHHTGPSEISGRCHGARWPRRLCLCLIAAVVLLCLPVVAEACPSCKQSLVASSNPHLVRGFGWSIIFMLSMPFLILATLGGYFFTLIRRADRIVPANVATHPISVTGS